jgi:hypothetical protein
MTVHIANELNATVQAALPQLRALHESAVTHRPAPDRWTIKEVIGHLIDSAANNHQRFVRAQLAEELVFPKYQQNEWVNCQHYNAVDWLELIKFWSLFNQHVTHVIRNADVGKLDVKCSIGDYAPVTLRFLMEDYVVHLKHHLDRIAERV